MNALSLFSGAGGLDVGFKRAGFNIVWANDFDNDSCDTYKTNLGNHITCSDINKCKSELEEYKNTIDLIIGGPPCQGFSVAGYMDADDPRSKLVWDFAEIVNNLQPKAFVMENVKALGQLTKWEPLKRKLLKFFRDSGYAVNYAVLNACDFDVPQSRERVFFIGFKNNPVLVPDIFKMIEPYKQPSRTVREALATLDRAGTGNNKGICKAKITLTPNPVLRKSPFAGMLFNGLGRPVRIDGYCSTLPASMGGNKTPIIDESELYDSEPGWVQNYHAGIMRGDSPLPFQEAPKRLRRLTVEEAAILQSFPQDYIFCGSQSSKFRQIGNAVPCNLSYRIGKMMMDYVVHDKLEHILLTIPRQLEIEKLYV